jgi:hypothetical protein
MACGQALLLADPQPVDAPVDGAGASSSSDASDAAETSGRTDGSTATNPLDAGCASNGWEAYNAYRDAQACRPLECVSTNECPATWAETIADKFEFCTTRPNEIVYDAFRSTEACRGWLRYALHPFDAGPRYCLYDPATGRLAGYEAIAGKASYEEWTCGFGREDFNERDCPGLTCAQVETPDGGVCPPGVKRCADRAAQTCDATGQWDTGTTCPYACIRGACTGGCIPGAKECNALVPRTCDDRGQWYTAPPCAHACASGTCGGVCDGSCACSDGICPPVTLAKDDLDSLAIDATNLYWSTYAQPRTIMKRALAGGPPVLLAVAPNITGQLAIQAGYLYWAEATAVKRISIDGGLMTTVLSSTEAFSAIAVDDENVYWSHNVFPTTSSTLMKSPLAGGAATPIATTVATQLVRDAANLYWADNSAVVGGDLLTMPLSGGPMTRIATKQGTITGFTVDATRIYWITYDRVQSAPLTGGTATILAQSGGRALAVDGTNAYWTSEVGVTTVPLSGGTPTTLASTTNAFWSIAVDAKYVYWRGDGLNQIAK